VADNLAWHSMAKKHRKKKFDLAKFIEERNKNLTERIDNNEEME